MAQVAGQMVQIRDILGRTWWVDPLHIVALGPVDKDINGRTVYLSSGTSFNALEGPDLMEVVLTFRNHLITGAQHGEG